MTTKKTKLKRQPSKTRGWIDWNKVRGLGKLSDGALAAKLTEKLERPVCRTQVRDARKRRGIPPAKQASEPTVAVEVSDGAGGWLRFETLTAAAKHLKAPPSSISRAIQRESGRVKSRRVRRAEAS